MKLPRNPKAVAGPRPVRLLLVDDHEMVRIGLRTLLEEDEDILVVGEAATSATAVAEAARLKPDVVLMDVRLPDASGAEACTDIRSKSLRTRGVSARILGHVSSRW